MEEGANLVPFKSTMNRLHLKMSKEGFSEIFVFVHN